MFKRMGDQVTSKLYVDNLVRKNVDESTLLSLDLDEKSSLEEQDSIILNSTLTSLKTDIEISKTKIELPTINYVDKIFDVSSIIKKHYSC